jgi:hypothetical protein
MRQGRLDPQTGLGYLEQSLRTWRDIHAAVYPSGESGVAQETSAPPVVPHRTSEPLDRDRFAMPEAPDVFVQFIGITAPEYGGLVESCSSMLDQIGGHGAGRESALEILERQVRRLSELYSALAALGRARSGFALKEALFVAMQLVQFPIDIQTSADCDARSTDPMLPISLALLLWAQPHDGDRIPFVEMSCAAEDVRIVIAPDRAAYGPDFVEVPAQGHSSPAWLRTVASAVDDGGATLVVRSNGQISTFAVHQATAVGDAA